MRPRWSSPVYQPEADDDWPEWKRRALNALVVTIWLAFLALFGGAVWAIWTHQWVIPIIAVPILVWAFISTVTHR